MLHIVAGYPSLKESEDLAFLMAKLGADFIEIQIPFSDPVADGETIMKANEIALSGGIRVKDCFDLMQRLGERSRGISSKTKFLFMTYFNIVFRQGVKEFCRKASECGAYGLIIPDMPIDEEKNEGYLAACKKYNLNAIQVVSPLTSKERLNIIADNASGFLYCVSRFGITGQSKNLNPKLKSYLRAVKKVTDLPLAVGFGLSEKEHLVAVWKEAEIAVMGSKIINLLNEGGKKAVEKFLREIKEKPSSF